jgi:GNAT superfamily N-acetyltransferase
MPRRFTPEYREETRDKRGQPIVFRLIRPDDKDRLLDGLRRMSPESRFRRFFSHRDRLSQAELRYLTELDHENHVAIGVAALGADGAEDGLGVARFVRIEPHDVAEAAVAVVDDAQGRGLGRMLFERLVRAANERGVQVFRFEVLAENDAMLGLIEHLFPGTTGSIEDNVITLDCPLPDLSAHGEQDLSEGLLYRVLRLAASGSLAVLRGARLGPLTSLTLKREDDPTELEALAARIGVTDEDGPGPS